MIQTEREPICVIFLALECALPGTRSRFIVRRECVVSTCIVSIRGNDNLAVVLALLYAYNDAIYKYTYKDVKKLLQ